MTPAKGNSEQELTTLVQSGRKSMKRTFTLILAALAAAALFGGLVYAVLVAAHVSEPAAATVYGLTPRRFWATAAAGLALVGVVTGGLALRRSAGRIGTGHGRLLAIVALAAGLIALATGGLNFAVPTAGPGTGPAVERGAAAQIPCACSIGIFVVMIATAMSIRSGTAAHRVNSPTMSSAPHVTSTTPTNGARNSGAGSPICTNRPTPSVAGNRDFWIPSARNTAPTSSRIKTTLRGP